MERKIELRDQNDKPIKVHGVSQIFEPPAWLIEFDDGETGYVAINNRKPVVKFSGGREVHGADALYEVHGLRYDMTWGEMHPNEEVKAYLRERGLLPKTT